MYFALFTGWLITSLLSALINIENKSYDSFIICLSGAFIGLVFFLIISLDHPFAGSIRIEPSAYNDLLKYIINQ